eukprot:gene2139-17726_t
MSTFGNLEPFEGGEFLTYKERLEAFFVANNIGIVPDDATDAVVQAAERRKVAVTISLIGKKTYATLKDLCLLDSPAGKSYNRLCDLLCNYFKPKVSEVVVNSGVWPAQHYHPSVSINRKLSSFEPQHLLYDVQKQQLQPICQSNAASLGILEYAKHYERMVDENGQRVAAFGKFAEVVVMIHIHEVYAMQRMNLRNIQKIARPYFQQFSYQHGWRVLSSKPHLSKTKVESGKILALRREDINVWERRAPIAPQHIKSLKEQGINTLVQPSARRAYTMQEYENAGAIITEDLSPASVIIGVKQVPIDLLIPDKSYAFFSHTIKAQEANMPLLDAMLAKNIRIIDYERMVDENGQRVAAFGKFAGFAGMYIGAAHNCKNSRQAKLAIYELGEDIKAGKLPAHFGPLTFVFTGSGNVSQGAQEMFKELPHVYVEPHELKHAAQKYDHRTLVYTKVSRQDYLVPKLGGSFQASEFEAHPERYRSVFAEELDSTVKAGRPKKEESYSARLTLLVQKKRKSNISIVKRDAIKPEMENFYNVCLIFSKTFLTKISNKPMIMVASPKIKRMSKAACANGFPPFSRTAKMAAFPAYARKGYWLPTPLQAYLLSAEIIGHIAPYANVIINGVYWASKNPRLLTYKDALTLLEPKTEHDKNSGCPDLPHTLLAICDISNDLGGSIEFMKENTTIECPFALHDIKKGTKQLGPILFFTIRQSYQILERTAGDGVLICSIENLPAQLPREATDYFGRLLLPWIPEMVNCDARRPLSMESGISNVVKNAIICSNGELTENYKYIADLRARHENERKQAKLGFQSSVSKKILVLGAGKVSSPFIEYHTRRQSTGVTVVSRSKDRVQHLANRHENTTPVVLDIERSHEGLDKLIQSHDVVVSLLPYLHSPTIASLCIKHKKNMVTATYVLPAMKELHERAKEAGITIFQENGLDPGIDHLLAMDCIDSIKEEGGKVESFISYCGGLPAPEHSDNPLRYKFSWSPNDTLLTLLNGARFLKNGQLMEIEPGMLLENVSPLDIFPGFHLEGYPNRDSTKYVQSFNIPEVKTMLRSAIRYHGYAAVCRGILSLGLLKKDPYPANMVGKTSSWKDLMNLQFGRFTLSEKELEILVRGRLQNDEIAFQGVKGLGLLSEESVQIGQTPFDTLSTHLSRILEYSKGERDIVLLRLQIREFKNNGKRVQHDISLVEYGDPNGFSAMARTTGIPTAIAADMVLNGEILQTGNVTPFAKGIYKPMLKRIQAEDICWTHKTTEL